MLFKTLPTICLLMLAATTITASAQSPRTWKSADGKFSVQATFAGIEGDAVQLKRADTGELIRVPLQQLSPEDQAAANKSAKGNAAANSESNATTTMEKKGGAKQQNIGVQQISELEFQLAPFGKIEIPADGMMWRVASAEPPVFLAQKPNDPQALILSVLPPATSNAGRTAQAKAVYNTLITQMKAGKITGLRGDQPTLSGDIPDSLRFSIAGMRSDNIESHFTTELLFNERHTFVFQATSTNAENVAFLMEDVKTFVPTGGVVNAIASNNVPKASIPDASIPDEVAKGVRDAIRRIQEQLASGDTEGLLKDLMPKDVYESMSSDPAQWKRVVDGFKERKAAELADVLQQVDFSDASYDADAKSIKFPVGRRGLEFKNVDGRWVMQN